MGLDIYFNKVKESGVGYFRKVNFLVSYFEDRGYEVDNLKPIEITKEDAEELRNRCRTILNHRDKAEELLPTCSGFFFGSTEYDEYYFEDIQNVLDFCEDYLIPLFDELDSDERICFKIWY